MAKLPAIKRFAAEDFPSQKAWISDFFQGLNQFLESVVRALDKSLTIADNIDAQLAQVSVSTPTAATTLTDNAVFKVTTKSRPTNLIVGRVDVITGTAITGAVQPTWDYVPASNSIKITSFTGLAANSKYKINLTIFTS